MAQETQLCEKMAEPLGDRVILNAYVSHVEHDNDGVMVTAGDTVAKAKHAIITLPTTRRTATRCASPPF